MIDTIPAWVLTIAYWLHMLATVVWIGGLVAFNGIVLPAAKKSPDPGVYTATMRSGFKRLQQIGWLSLAVLTVTGLFQMSSHPAYEGFLAINTQWAGAILAKHAVIAVMVGLAAYSTWILGPQLERMEIQKKHGKALPEQDYRRLERRETNILRANLVISILVLFFTALARVS